MGMKRVRVIIFELFLIGIYVWVGLEQVWFLTRVYKLCLRRVTGICTPRGMTVTFFSLLYVTSRDRPKSAPYPRLKNSKKTSKCQVFFYRSRKSKIFRIFFLKKLHTKKIGPSGAPGLASASPWRANVSQCRKTERGDPLRFFNIHSVAKHEKIEEIFFCFREKILQCRKKLKGGTLWDFPTSILSQNIKKMQGGPFEEKNFEKNFRKKCLQCRKKLKGGTLWSLPVWYVTRKNR